MTEKTLRVVLVEDDAESRASIKGLLDAAGSFAVSVAETGAKGLAVNEKDNPDCLLVSYDLADLDGLAFLDKLAGDSGIVTTPVVMLLSKDKKMTVTKVLSGGAQDYLIKGELNEANVARAVRNASEIKLLGNRLLEQRNIFRAILQGNAGFLMLKNTQYQYQAANPVFCKFIGRKLEEVVGKGDDVIFPKEEAQANRKFEGEVFTSDQKHVQIQQLTGKDGKRWFEIARSPLKDAANRTVGILCDAQDITKIKELEDKISQLGDVDKDALKRAEAEVAGLRQQLEQKEKALADLSQHVADNEKAAAELSTQIQQLQKQSSERDAEAKAALARATELENEAKTAVGRAAQAEEKVGGLESQVAAADERFHQVTELVLAAICECGADTKITYFNPAGFNLFGYSESDLGKGISLSDLFHATEKARVAQGIKDSMQGKAHGPVEYRMVRKDAGEILALVNAAPVVKSGKIAGMRFTMADYGQHKRLRDHAHALSAMASAAAAAVGAANRVTDALARAASTTESALPPNEGVLGELREALLKAEAAAERL